MSCIKWFLETEVGRLATKYHKDWYDVMMLANEMMLNGELDLPDCSKLEARLKKQK